MTWGRNVPAALQAKLDSRTTTLCMLLRITPVSGDAFGLSSTNVDVDYDDGNGTITYVSQAGFDPSAVAFTSGTGVDNSEAGILFGTADSLVLGITEEMVDSGYLDEARYILYLIDYLDHPSGEHVEVASGKVGDIMKRRNAARVECRSRTQQLAQKGVCETGSITCRATFGDATTGCGFDISTTWVSGTVTFVHETDRQFDTDLTDPVNTYAPGLVEWLTGDNTGRSYEVESYDATGIVTLAHPVYYDVQSGDTFRIRKECPKTRAACVAFGQILNFRGEPDTPEAESRSNQTPRTLHK